MEPGPGGDIEHFLGPTLPEAVDEELSLALGPQFPVDQRVPLLHEGVDVLFVIVVGVADLVRLRSKVLSFRPFFVRFAQDSRSLRRKPLDVKPTGSTGAGAPGAPHSPL